jgi:hypothetical protein
VNNFTMLAQNSNYDYILQACLAAMSIRATNKNANICLITNNDVPDKYKQLFNYIIDIPWGDHAEDYEWKIHNRWKIYHAVPYEETVVMDTDMLVLEDLSSWFNFLQTYDLFFPTKVFTYRNEEVKDNNYYRKAFSKFNLPNIYTGFHWFKKRDLPHEFYTWLEMITNNWQQFYKYHAGGKIYQNTCSIDVSSAIAVKILDCESQVTNSKVKYPSFVHMKQKIQDWNLSYGERWQDRVGVYLNEDLTLRIGNYVQSGVFHYTEKDFVNEKIILTYEKSLGI